VKRFRFMKVVAVMALLTAVGMPIGANLSSAAQNSTVPIAAPPTPTSSGNAAEPSWPAAGASTATWQAYSQQTASFWQTTIAQLTGSVVTGSGGGLCQYDTPTMFSFPGTVIGAPQGVTLYGISGALQCATNSVTATRYADEARVAHAAIPLTSGCNTSSISYGVQGTGIAHDCYSALSSSDAAGVFTATGTGTGHEELSNASGLGSCGVGTLIGNHGDIVMSSGVIQYVETAIGSGSVTYAGTFWQYNSPGNYTNKVTVCDAI